MNEWNSGGNPAGQQCNRLLDAVVKIIKYKIGIIEHAIYIKVLSDRDVSHLTVPTDVVLNNSKN